MGCRGAGGGSSPRRQESAIRHGLHKGWGGQGVWWELEGWLPRGGKVEGGGVKEGGGRHSISSNAVTPYHFHSRIG